LRLDDVLAMASALDQIDRVVLAFDPGATVVGRVRTDGVLPMRVRQ
jgi:hypothetical protein